MLGGGFIQTLGGHDSNIATLIWLSEIIVVTAFDAAHGWRAMPTLNNADTLDKSPGSGVLPLPNPLLALTLQQPWASAVRDLGKRTENRSWPAPKRAVGSIIAIHAGQTFHEDAADWLAARTGRMLRDP